MPALVDLRGGVISIEQLELLDEHSGPGCSGVRRVKRILGVRAWPGETQLSTVEAITLHWVRFDSLTAARDTFGTTSCVYVQADRDGSAVRVGKASKGLHARYRGGTGWALDAAMHNSGNVVFVAGVTSDLVAAVEASLIWSHREALRYNKVGKRLAPQLELILDHAGDRPSFNPPTRA